MFVKMRTDGKVFKIGDYVKAEGRLDAYLTERGEENVIKKTK